MTSRQKTTSTNETTRSFPVLPVVFGLVAVLLVAVVVFAGGDPALDPDPDAPDEFGAPTVDGASLPIFTTTATDAAIGAQIPTVTGTDLDGEPITIGPDGTAKGIVFLAHWCGHCQAEVPRVTEWLTDTGGIDGVEIVSVATAMDRAAPNFPPSSWLEREEWSVPVLADDEAQTVHGAFGNGGFPYWVFVDADGNVVARTEGELAIDTLSQLLTLAAG